MAPVRRGYVGTLLDRVVTWAYDLPPESSSYTIESLLIPLEGDVKIAADLYRPVGKPIGTIFVRSPYGLGIAIAISNARVFAARSYQVLYSSCRGTAASGGEFDGARCEEADGHTIVAWMRKQAWYTGSFATLGPSYLGYVQWALLSNPPPDMKAAIINTGPHDFSNFAWEAGAFNSDAILWADFQLQLRRGSIIPAPLYPLIQGRQLRSVLDAIPLLDAVKKYFAANPPAWLLYMMTLSDLKDPHWKPLQHSGAFEKANIPILLTTGWYDLILPSVMEQYRRLSERGCNVALTVGPWTHLGAGGRNNMREALSWLDMYLSRQTEDNDRAPPVRIYITGKEEWKYLPKWPPSSVPYELFLGPARTLSKDKPPPDRPSSTFKFDPADPTPTIGVPLLFDGSEHSDNTSLSRRSDVLNFTTEPLDRDLEVCGQAYVELYHSSNHPHVDLLVVLSEVDSKGKSHHIAEKYLRLPVNRDTGLVTMVLHDCAHMFRKGNKVSLVIAGGSHPRFLRNLGTDESYATGTTLRSAWHTISHNSSEVSKFVLPIAIPES